MNAAYRLEAGGRIDRSRPVRFTFDGKRYDGFAGDTLASALIANGVQLRPFSQPVMEACLKASNEVNAETFDVVNRIVEAVDFNFATVA